LSVIIYKSGKPSRQCVEAEREPNLTVCIIIIKENSKPSQGYNILRFYKCNVGPQLEYYIQIVIARSRTWKTEESANKS